MTTTIILTDKIQELKKLVELNLDGMKLTHQAIYERGLKAYCDLVEMRKNKLDNA